MIDACIPPKSILVVDRSLTPKHGDIVVACINGGFTVKFLHIDGGAHTLVPANKNYQPIPVTTDMDFMVWGVVTNVVMQTKNIRQCLR